MAISALLSMLDPLSVSDLVLRGVVLVGFLCLFRANSYQLLKWRDITFNEKIGEDGVVTIEVIVSVPDSKAVGYDGANGGVNRIVLLKEYHVREMCPVRVLVAIARKMRILHGDSSWTIMPECLDMYVFPAVEAGILSPHRTVSLKMNVRSSMSYSAFSKKAIPESIPRLPITCH